MVTVEEAAPCYAFAVPAESQPRNATGTLLSAFDEQDKVFLARVLDPATSHRRARLPRRFDCSDRNGQLLALKSFGSFVYETVPRVPHFSRRCEK